MLTHTTSSKHWTIDASADGGTECSKCGAAPTHRCSGYNGQSMYLLPWNTVHVERVLNAGHRIVNIELPIHRAKVPTGALSELRKRMR